MIEVNNLNKRFKVVKRKAGLRASLKNLFNPSYTTVTALNDISFQINQGEIVGYIGPNGAGKSTTIKVMSGILVPNSGTCKILGRTPWKDRVDHVKDIGVVFGQRSQLWWDVPVIESFNLLKEIYKISDGDYDETLNHLTDILDISSILNIPVRQLSLGQRMRCEIAASLIHSPKILFLDEPTIGLDAVSKIAVRKFIKKINQEKKVTVILTTHDMSDIEALANRIILIGKGTILLDGTIEELRNRFGSNKILTVDYQNNTVDVQIEGVTLINKNEGRMTLKIDTKKISVSKVISKLSSICNIIDLTVSNRPVEEIIVDLYREYEL